MNKIVGVLKPFEHKQHFYVFNEEEKITEFDLDVDEIIDFIPEVANKYSAQVDLNGPRSYTEGIIKKIKKSEFDKYSNNTIVYNII